MVTNFVFWWTEKMWVENGGKKNTWQKVLNFAIRMNN